MPTTSSILIAGAGWRVSAFVIPALLSIGVSKDQITILRRKASAGDGILSNIRTVNKVEDLAKHYDLTINCVTRKALVRIQTVLDRVIPDAVHFCDTPIFSRISELPTVLRLARNRNIFSLEDWPYLPSLTPITELCQQCSDSYQLNFDHLGVPIHFLAGARVVARAAGDRGQRLVRKVKSGLSVRYAGSASTAIHRTPKDYSRAQISAKAGNRKILDRLEILPKDVSREVKPDQIVRQITRNKLTYIIGSRKFREINIPDKYLQAFSSQEPGKNAHELDKCVALMDIFSSALDNRTNACRYSESVRDALATRLAFGKLGISYFA